MKSKITKTDLYLKIEKITDPEHQKELVSAWHILKTDEQHEEFNIILNAALLAQSGTETVVKRPHVFDDMNNLKAALVEEHNKINQLITLYHKQHKTAYLAKERERLSSDLDAIVYVIDKDVKNYLIRRGVAKEFIYQPDSKKGPSDQKIDVFTTWIEDASTEDKQLFGMTYYPMSVDVVDGKWNTFYDTSVEAVEGDNHQMFLDFTKEVICNGNEEYYDYVIKWLAHLVQKPWQKPQAALSIASEIQGIGKSTFVDVLALMIGGRNSVVALSEKDVEGSFNYIMAEKLLINFDEATFAGDHRQAGFMKKLVTQSRSRVERKFGDAREVEDYSRVIITTNNVENGTPAGMTDRRWLLLEPSDTWKKDGRLHTLINTIGVQHSEDKQLDYEKSDRTAVQNLKWFLKNEVDISDFKPWETPRQTTGLSTRLAMAWREEPYHAFFIEWCYSGDTHLDTKDEHERGEQVQITFEQTMPAIHLWNALNLVCKGMSGVRVQKSKFYKTCNDLGFRYFTGTGNIKNITLPSREKVWAAIFKDKPRFAYELPEVSDAATHSGVNIIELKLPPKTEPKKANALVNRMRV